VFSASAQLTEAGFVVQQEQREDETGQYDEGQIWQQSPEPGTVAPVGSIVIIRVVPVPPSTTTPQTLPPVTGPPATLPTVTVPPEPPPP
jgi:beta-lactam-binding protein with PASTA domain